MKRKTTITLTIAGLLAMAGMFYAANPRPFAAVPAPMSDRQVEVAPAQPAATPTPTFATHSFFSAVHNPDPSPNQAGPLGVAAAPVDLIATEYCSFTGFTNVDKIDCFGGFAPIAQILTPNGGGCQELYMTIASSVAAGALPFPFAPRDYFITAGPKIYQLRPPIPPILYAVIPDGGCSNPGDHTGITFDKTGIQGFDFNMLVTCKGSGGVWQVQGNGGLDHGNALATVTNIGFVLDHNNQARHIENPAIVPRNFGNHGGELWVSDEDYLDTVTTIPGAVHAIDPNGNVTLDVVEWPGAEAVLVIPDTPCTLCSGGELFQAITLNEQGPYGLYQYLPFNFANLGGNVLIPAETSQGTALVTVMNGEYVTQVFDTIPGATFEGASFADCDVHDGHQSGALA